MYVFNGKEYNLDQFPTPIEPIQIQTTYFDKSHIPDSKIYEREEKSIFKTRKRNIKNYCYMSFHLKKQNKNLIEK